jgi:hypothetical protein
MSLLNCVNFEPKSRRSGPRSLNGHRQQKRLRDQPQHPPSTLTEPMLFLVVTRYAPPVSSPPEHSQEEQHLSPPHPQPLRRPAHSMATQR